MPFEFEFFKREKDLLVSMIRLSLVLESVILKKYKTNSLIYIPDFTWDSCDILRQFIPFAHTDEKLLNQVRDSPLFEKVKEQQ